MQISLSIAHLASDRTIEIDIIMAPLTKSLNIRITNMLPAKTRR